MYVLVRRDLRTSQQAVQACHAAIEAARKFLSPDMEHPHLVLCDVQDLMALERERLRLEANGVKLVAFHEPDLNGEMTAIATAPLTGECRRVMRRYRLCPG